MYIHDVNILILDFKNSRYICFRESYLEFIAQRIHIPTNQYSNPILNLIYEFRLEASYCHIVFSHCVIVGARIF